MAIFSATFLGKLNCDILTRASQQQEQVGPSINLKIRLTVEEIYAGKEHEVTYNRKVICPHCRGTGADDPSDVKKCSTCNGQGFTIHK